MTITERDRRILIVVLVLGVLGAYWFLLLSPKRKDASDLKTQIETAQTERDTALAAVQRARASRTSFAADYATVVRLGKAVPETVDMPSLLVQLESAANGTNIDFLSITAGDRTAATAPPVPTIPQDESSSSFPGRQRSKANTAVNQSNQANQAAQGTGTDTTTNTTTTGATEPPGNSPSAGAPGLDSVPLEFSFTGSYFDLADFFHRLKRFVRLTGPDGNRILVRGRLMVIDSITYTTSQEDFPQLAAAVKATVYLSPKAEGTTAGASPTGPSTTQPAGTTPPAAGQTTPAGNTGTATP